jgi:3-dehydroquinate synthase
VKTVTVGLDARSYPIHVGRELLPRAGEYLAQAGCRGRVAVVTNPTVAALYLPALARSLSEAGLDAREVVIPDGEEHKNLRTLGAVYDQLIRAGLERGSWIVALGGGVVGDLAGFAAATFLRGVAFAQIPTTLLAQVDASVGGKTAVNHRAGKNLIGAFYQPRLVLADVDVLRTLPRREFVAGLSEVIKYGIIEDAELFRALENDLGALLAMNSERLTAVIAASCAIKAKVVESDEREEDYRAVLNFGHTVGHALEAATAYRRFLHGEAVAIGIAAASRISVEENLLAETEFARILELLAKAGLPATIPADIDRDKLVRKMEVDKKATGGKVRFVLCAGIGRTRFHWLEPRAIAAKLKDA